MRLAGFSILLLTLVVSPAVAEERVNVLPEIVIGGGTGSAAGAATPSERCAHVESGSKLAMDCLNRKLKNQVDRVNPVLNLPPIDARSGDTKVGVINIPGVQQQYGKNFGVSAAPFRPAAPVFTSPIAPRH